MEKELYNIQRMDNEAIGSFKSLLTRDTEEDRTFFCKLFVEKCEDGFYLAGELLSERRVRELNEFFNNDNNRQFLSFDVAFFKAKKASSLSSIVKFLSNQDLLHDSNSSLLSIDLGTLNNRLFPLVFQAVQTDENVHECFGQFSIYSFQNGDFFEQDPKLSFSLPSSTAKLSSLLNSVFQGLSQLAPFQPKDAFSENVDKVFSLNVGQASCTYGLFNFSQLTSAFFDVGFERLTNLSKFQIAQATFQHVQPGGFVVLSHFDLDHFLGAAFSTSKSHNLFLKKWIIPNLSSIKKPELLLSSLSLSATSLLASLLSVPNPSIFWLPNNGQWTQIANNVYARNAYGKGRNNSGVVSYVSGRDGLLFIPGDADYRFWPTTPAPISTMIVPHHGGYTQIPSSVKFSSSFKSIIYSGINSYGHPNLCSLIDLHNHRCTTIWRFQNDVFPGLGLKAYCGAHSITDPFSSALSYDLFLLFK